MRISADSAKKLIKADFNYDHLRAADPVHQIIIQAKQIIPEGSRINMSPSEWNYFRCKSRYALFPLELDRINWQYFIDFSNQISNPPADWSRFNLVGGVPLYAKPYSEFNAPVKIKKVHYPKGKILFTFIWITLFQIFTGMMILSILRIGYESKLRIWYFGTYYLVGFIATNVLSWFFVWAGGKFTAINILIVWSALTVLLLTLAHNNLKNNFKKIVERKVDGETSLIWDQIPVFITCLLILIVLIPTIFTSVWSWDAMSHWIMKSKMLFEYQQFDFNYSKANLHPPLWSQASANAFLFMNGVYDEVAKWTSGLVMLAFFSQIYGGLKILDLKNKWVWLVMSIYVLCFMNTDLMIAYAEGIFVAFIAGMLTALIYYLKTKDRGVFMLAVLFAIGLTAVKVEGFIAVGIIAFAVASLGRPPFRSKRHLLTATGLALPILLFVLWVYWWVQSGYYSPFYHTREGFYVDNLILVSKLLPQSIFLSLGVEFYLFFTALLVLIFWTRKSKENECEHVLFWTSILLILFSIVAFSAWDQDEISKQIMSISRIFFHATPALIYYFGLKLKSVTNHE